MAFAGVIEALLGGKPFTIYGSGEQSRDFTFVDDAVTATIAAMDGGPSGTTYNVGGGSETSLNDAIGLCQELAGTGLEVINQPAARGDVRRTVRIRPSSAPSSAGGPRRRSQAASPSSSRPRERP